MDVPVFSVFSAISEIAVTVIVLYAVIGSLRGGPFRWKLLGGALLFEFCVNIIYMVRRAAEVETHGDLSPTLTALLAAHGILSLIMFVALVLTFLASTFAHKAGRPTWFRRHRTATWTLIVLWLISVGSGEAAFVWRYFPFA